MGVVAERFCHCSIRMGAVQALVSVEHRDLIKDVIKDVDYIELTTYENFQQEFVKAMYMR